MNSAIMNNCQQDEEPDQDDATTSPITRPTPRTSPTTRSEADDDDIQPSGV
jgi:hypothetical protein